MTVTSNHADRQTHVHHLVLWALKCILENANGRSRKEEFILKDVAVDISAQGGVLNNTMFMVWLP